MAWIKDTKANQAAKDAERAASEGHKVMVWKFDMPNLNSAVSSSVSGAAEAIEAIEDRGWHLDSYALHPGVRHGSMVMIFRRVV